MLYFYTLAIFILSQNSLNAIINFNASKTSYDNWPEDGNQYIDENMILVHILLLPRTMDSKRRIW